MNAELSIEITYRDIHLIEIDIRASNVRFMGTTSTYIGFGGGELIDLARKLQGFPKRVDQIEEQAFGKGEANFRFLCIDGLGTHSR